MNRRGLPRASTTAWILVVNPPRVLRQAQDEAADRTSFRPPFLPAACWCARTMVESIMTYSKSGSSAMAANNRSHTSPLDQREKRTNTLFQLPKISGRSRHGEPTRATHNTASTNSRLSPPVRPGSLFLPGRCGAIRSHWWSFTIKRTPDIQRSQAEMRARQRLRAQSGSVQPRQHYIEAQVVATVVGIVRRWCRSASEEKAIAHIRRNLRWRGSYDRLFRPARVTTAMRQFEDADAVRRWFELADQHVTAAETARLGGRKLTQRLVNDVEFAVMSQLLRDSPIRIRTLAALRIAGDHPNITQGGSPFLVIYAADNKNFKPIKAPLSS